MSITVNDDVHSVTKVTQLLARLGYDDERLGSTVELAIDRFDQWTNPRAAVVMCTCSRWSAAEVAFERVM